MKKRFTKICVILTITLTLVVSSLGHFSSTYADQSTVLNQANAFIENMLPLDLSHYSVTLRNHLTLNETEIAGAIGQSKSNNRVIDTVRYTLTSEEGTVNVNCKIENDVIKSCHVYLINGTVISDKHYTNSLDAVKSFLGKYQNYTKTDNANLIAMLDNVDINKNSTKIEGNAKLTIANTEFAGEELTRFEWTYTENGVDYTSLQVKFQKNGVFKSFIDTRAIYTIGDTSINFSSEQAINIALDYLPSYSYEMPDHTWINNFNVTEDRITTALESSSVNYPEMRPYWHVILPLNQTYPGSVQGIAIYIWANTGEILSCSNIAYGGIEYTDDNLDTESPKTENIETNQPQNNTTTPNSLYVVGLAVAIIGITSVSAIILKKRKK